MSKNSKLLQHGTYIGPRADLNGETALLLSRIDGRWDAQLDDLDKFGHSTDEKLAYGLHIFDHADFLVDNEESMPQIFRLPVIIFLAFWITAAVIVVRAML